MSVVQGETYQQYQLRGLVFFNLKNVPILLIKLKPWRQLYIFFSFLFLFFFSWFQLCFPVPFLSLIFICFFHLVVFVLLCSALLSSSTCFSIRCLSPSFFFVQLRLLALLSSPTPPVFDVGLFPLVLILPPKLCQHSHIGRFFGFFWAVALEWTRFFFLLVSVSHTHAYACFESHFILLCTCPWTCPCSCSPCLFLPAIDILLFVSHVLVLLLSSMPRTLEALVD